MSADKPDDTRTHESDFAAVWSSDGVTRSFAPTASGLPADLPFLFAASQQFGPYVIVRPIGKGGMGQVYEAEEVDSGRRIALKLLSRGLGDDEERERFLREGQLAASLSHPNCVYVFGTSEIQGFPVIAMELVPEGTLKDLVVADKPMSAAAAVDAVLQVIAGLEAAASIGILHRDIKPSNCFVHRDGRVLVGDFGLSVAAASREARDGGQGTILGTPGFASPEQLRGESLDVRSDIYSVGATLFYLLAGRAPFDERTTTSLMARIATEPPPLLTKLRPELPKGLASIVARCLAKTPAERFTDYAALRAALEPFGAARLAAAPIVRRALAGILDAWLLGLPMIPLNLLLSLQPLAAAHRADGLVIAGSKVLVAVLYYGLLEGLLGTTAGKAIFGLRVVDEHQVTPGVPRASLRALAFEGPTQLVKQLVVWLTLRAVSGISVGFVEGVTSTVWLMVLFAPARKRNGYAALHDRVTRTRVVRRRIRAAARNRAVAEPIVPATVIEGSERIGPYLVPPATPLDVAEPVRIEGFDDRLQRRVSIELLPRGTAPLSAARRDLGRRTRVRWLAGRRDANECWDAYEAVDGVPLSAIATAPQRWSRVRHWLLDLTQETVAGLGDGTLPLLDIERVWIDRDDHVRLVDWRGGSSSEAGGGADIAAIQRFLYGVAVAAVTGLPFERASQTTPEIPLPLSARTLLLSLRDGRFTSPDALLAAATEALSTPADVARSSRIMQIGACAALPVLITLFAIGAIFVLRASKAGDRALFTIDACLNELERAEKKLKKGPDRQAQQIQDDVQIYLAEHFADKIRSEDTWNQAIPDLGAGGGRARAERALAAHAVRTPEEVRRADATVAGLLEDQASGLDKFGTPTAMLTVAIAILAGMFSVAAAFAALGALASGSGFTFRPSGLALVNRRGQPISRARALLRAAIVWAPLAALLLLIKYGPDVAATSGWRLLLEWTLMAIFAAAAGWAIARPSRGIQDRIAGTWIVPR